MAETGCKAAWTAPSGGDERVDTSRLVVLPYLIEHRVWDGWVGKVGRELQLAAGLV